MSAPAENGGAEREPAAATRHGPHQLEELGFPDSCAARLDTVPARASWSDAERLDPDRIPLLRDVLDAVEPLVPRLAGHVRWLRDGLPPRAPVAGRRATPGAGGGARRLGRRDDPPRPIARRCASG